MKLALLMLITLGMAGCQTVPAGRMTVIAPQATEEASQPTVKWVKRDNVFYLELQRPE
jgi:hypothetical protein